tara:strand:- start:1033 stop:1143 length:111 start_codon:yes stop_codon:yes gene_type:complete
MSASVSHINERPTKQAVIKDLLESSMPINIEIDKIY